jgi:4-hydroxybenzoate polyprenyltransferase
MPYVKIARPDHWFKNVFMLPGVIFAFFDLPQLMTSSSLLSIVIGFASVCLIASSNYTINEILDGPKDALHPVKCKRPVPSGQVNIKLGYAQWVLLGVAGLVLAWQVNLAFFFSAVALLVMGLLYNVPPARLKDMAYLDVLSESVNNPLRLFMGWFTVNAAYPPTLSLILAYWMIGAFFMSVKRYAEYRRIGNKERATQYRKSFSYYNEYRLILSMVYYAAAFSLFFGIFMIRYRIELILAVPFMAGFIPVYMRLAFWKDSPAQYPERLYRQKGLMIYTVACSVIILGLLFIDMPFLDSMFNPLHMPGTTP